MLSFVRTTLLALAAQALAAAIATAGDAAGEGASESTADLEVPDADTLSIDLVLTGTLVRDDPSNSKALFVTKEGEVEEMFGVGDEISDGVFLQKIQRQRILAEKGERSYWIGIKQSTSSELAANIPNSNVAPVDRVDRPEFYTPDGVLMEGAAARYYGVDLDAEPVQEIVDMGQRLENLPQDVKLRNGVPETWWNPNNSSYTSDENESRSSDP